MESCHLLIIRVNRVDPNQDRQNIDTDRVPNCLTLILCLEQVFEKKRIFKKKSADGSTSRKFTPAYKELKEYVQIIYPATKKHLKMLSAEVVCCMRMLTSRTFLAYRHPLGAV